MIYEDLSTCLFVSETINNPLLIIFNSENIEFIFKLDGKMIYERVLIKALTTPPEDFLEYLKDNFDSKQLNYKEILESSYIKLFEVKKEPTLMELNRNLSRVVNFFGEKLVK